MHVMPEMLCLFYLYSFFIWVFDLLKAIQAKKIWWGNVKQSVKTHAICVWIVLVYMVDHTVRLRNNGESDTDNCVSQGNNTTVHISRNMRNMHMIGVLFCCVDFSHVLQSNFIDIMRLPLCQWNKHEKYGQPNHMHLPIYMMTSSNGNIFRVTGPLCGEFAGHRWIPLTKASDAEIGCFVWSAPWINGWVYRIAMLVIWDAIALIMT